MKKLIVTTILIGSVHAASAQFYTTVPGPDATDLYGQRLLEDTMQLCSDAQKMVDQMNNNGGRLATVLFLNCTQKTIRSIYTAPSSHDSFPPDHLSGVLGPTTAASVTIGAFDVYYNIRIVFTNGESVDFSRYYIGHGVSNLVLTQTGANNYTITRK